MSRLFFSLRYTIMENMRYMLSTYNSSFPIYFGSRFKKFSKQGYMSGGKSLLSLLSLVPLREALAPSTKNLLSFLPLGSYSVTLCITLRSSKHLIHTLFYLALTQDIHFDIGVEKQERFTRSGREHHCVSSSDCFLICLFVVYLVVSLHSKLIAEIKECF